MSNYIEQILQKLLTPDSTAIKQATKQLLDYFVSDKCINGLLEVLNLSPIIQNRIYAATLLRKKIKNWKSLKKNEQILIKQQVIECMVKEPEESVRKQIMYLIASTYRYSFKSKEEWPDLFKLIQELITSQSPEQNLASIFILSILNEEAAEEMKPHYTTLLNIFIPILKTSDNLKLILYVLNSLKNMYPYVSDDQLNGFRSLIPDAINASIKLLHSDKEKETATNVFDFFHSLIEYETNVIAPYLTNLVETVLKITEDQNLPNSTRICALNYVNSLIETQKLTLIKTDMIRPIVNTIFTIMCHSNAPLQTKTDMEVEDDNYNDENEENLFTCASQVLDYCALYFPPKKFIKILVEFVNPVVRHENPLYRRAALAALAVTSEGCADHYRNHYLEFLVDLCIKGVFDSDVEVVSTSFFALGQFTEYLTPNITHYAQRIMHVFIQYIEQNPQIQLVSRLTVRFYDALQAFCENLGEELETYIEALMSKLMQLVSQNNLTLKLQRLIICTFSSIVTSIKARFEPYFDLVVQMIKPYLAASTNQQSENEQFELKLLQIECIDLMGILAKYMNDDKFSSNLINDCLLYVQHVLNNDDDAEKRSAVYDLLAGLTSKLNENIPLQQLMPQLIETLKSEEGINIIDSDEKVAKDGLFSAFDEIDLEDTEEDDLENDEDENIDDDDEEGNKLVIENEYVAEKLSALYCLQETCKYQNPQLIDFYRILIEETTRLSIFVHLHIRRESYLALAKLITNFHDYCKINVNLNQNEVSVQTLMKDILNCVGNCTKTIECDADRQLVMSCFDALSVLLSGCSQLIKENLNYFGETLEKLGNLVINAFKNKIFCQTVAQDNDGEENQMKLDDLDENQAEYDYMIKEFAGDLVPALALCLPDDAFDKYFEKILHYLYRILNKSESTVAEKSFVIGVIGETVGNIANLNQQKAVLIYKGLQSYMIDRDDEVRSNTIFTTGVLCSQSNGALKNEYGNIIKDLFIILNNEKNKQVLDNICGTLSRLFYSCVILNVPNIDYVTILNKIFELTPLKTDQNEYLTLYSMIVNLQSHNLMLNYFPKIIELSGHVLFNKHYECRSGIKELIINFLNYVNTAYNQDLLSMLDRMKFEYANVIRSNLKI